MKRFVTKIKQMLCKHEWADDWVVYKTFWPYSEYHIRVRKCKKCGKVVRREVDHE